MNPFVNPRKFIHVVLFQAQLDNATELVIGKALPDGTTPIRYKVKETWQELSPFPSDFRPVLILELAQMAKFASEQTVGQGAFDWSSGSLRARWMVDITSADDECRLIRIQKEAITGT